MKQIISGSILEHFSILPDPRRENHNTKQHELLDIIIITILAMICGAETWIDIVLYGQEKKDWLKTFLVLPSGIPSHDTFGRVFSILDPDAFQTCFFAWVKTVHLKTKGKVVAIDGKSVRRSHAKDTKPLHLISAFAVANGVTLGQRKVDGKSNEITAIPELLSLLDISGCIITIDAMGCQTNIAERIIDKRADYVLAVKGNQGYLHKDIQGIFVGMQEWRYDHYETKERGHGRDEHRECFTIGNPTALTAIRSPHEWKQLKSIAMVISTRTIDEKTTVDIRYYVSSLQSDAKKILEATRSHWGIENSLHWMLDVAFREDESRVRIGNAQENLSIVRKLALLMLKQERTKKVGVAAKRKTAGWSNEYLLRVLGIAA
jgi:predicted transposase YbfD/YdcC